MTEINEQGNKSFKDFFLKEKIFPEEEKNLPLVLMHPHGYVVITRCIIQLFCFIKFWMLQNIKKIFFT